MGKKRNFFFFIHTIRDNFLSSFNHIFPFSCCNFILYHSPLKISYIYFFTMMLIALWHSTTLGFVAFGVLHGCVLVSIQLRVRYLPAGTAIDRIISTHLGAGTLQWTKRGVTYVFMSLSMFFWMYGVAGTFEVLSRMFGGD